MNVELEGKGVWGGFDRNGGNGRLEVSGWGERRGKGS